MDSTLIADMANKLSGLYFSNPEANIESELAKEADLRDLNANMIERVVNRTNRNIIMGLQKQARLGSADPHFTFPRVETSGVISLLRGGEAPTVIRMGPTLPPRPAIEPMQPAEQPTLPPAMCAMDKVLKLKAVLAQKKSALIRYEMALDEMLRVFMTRASHQLIGGTPIDVFERLPVDITPVVEKVASWGHPIKRIDQEWEIDEQDPLVKLAFDIKQVEGSRAWAQKEVQWAEKNLDEAREVLRENSK